MSFWTYMLHCADRTFYVGHADDLQVRVWQHEIGYFETCYTFAFAMERWVKGWSRAKKIALIREDWSLIGDLARCSEEKKGVSTGSARAGEM